MKNSNKSLKTKVEYQQYIIDKNSQELKSLKESLALKEEDIKGIKKRCELVEDLEKTESKTVWARNIKNSLPL